MIKSEDSLQVHKDDEQNTFMVIRPGYRPILNHVVAECDTEAEAIQVAEALDSHDDLMRVAELLVETFNAWGDVDLQLGYSAAIDLAREILGEVTV